MDNTGFQDPTAGMDPEQHVRWLQATGQESSCADIDSAHNQGILGSDGAKSEGPPMSAEELRRQKRRKINRESARRMRLKPRLEVQEQKTMVQVLLSQLTLLQDAYKRLLDDYNTLRQDMYNPADALPQ
ncbi:g1898 [Coccomyxa elongata]